MFLVLPDLGFVGLNENAETAVRVRAAVELPLIVDADTGFGDALKLRHAGACALRLDDEVMPRKCGQSTGQEGRSATKVRFAQPLAPARTTTPDHCA
jgi:2-methylisocitrate lyase-like PEP mutase family enzyme